MRDPYNGYKPNNTIDMNSPEIARLAYGPEMNAHVAKIKEARKNTSDKFKNDVGLEFADHIKFADKRPVSIRSHNVTLVKIKPKFCFICGDRVFTYSIINGIVYGQCHRSMSSEPMVDQVRERNRQNKGARNGIKKYQSASRKLKVQRNQKRS